MRLCIVCWFGAGAGAVSVFVCVVTVVCWLAVRTCPVMCGFAVDCLPSCFAFEGCCLDFAGVLLWRFCHGSWWVYLRVVYNFVWLICCVVCFACC